MFVLQSVHERGRFVTLAAPPPGQKATWSLTKKVERAHRFSSHGDANAIGILMRKAGQRCEPLPLCELCEQTGPECGCEPSGRFS